MSRAPFIRPDARRWAKRGEARSLDRILGTLPCPFDPGRMGVTAGNVATERGVTCEDQDARTPLSQASAANAVARDRLG